MILKVIGTGSKGNTYILENDTEALVIECGMSIKSIKEAVNFNVGKIAGCIVTHEHQDHCKSINQLFAAGVNVFASGGTLKALKATENHRAHAVKNKVPFYVGGFKIMAFDVKHDCAEPFGFLINHKETGNVLFLTDTFYSAYTFKNLNNIIIEANFSKKIIDAKLRAGATPKFLRDRILKNHFSLENCLDALSKNDITAVNNIVLIHLSDTNSHAVDFKTAVQKQTNKTVTIAENGIQIPFNKTPF